MAGPRERGEAAGCASRRRAGKRAQYLPAVDAVGVLRRKLDVVGFWVETAFAGPDWQAVWAKHPDPNG
jgi:hypothetical protein